MATQNRAPMKTFFYTLAAIGDIKQAMTKGDKSKPFASFKGVLTTNAGVEKERTVTVFNTVKNPNLVAETVALLSKGPARMVVTFDKGRGEVKGETARIVGLGRQTAANDDQQVAEAA